MDTDNTPLSQAPSSQSVPGSPSHDSDLDTSSTSDFDYQNAISFLYSRINYEKSMPADRTEFRLDRMRDFAAFLGCPQDQYPIVHVAGTKGKGTVSNLIAASLKANDLKTGLYTSPHLIDLEERYCVDGIQISRNDLANLIGKIRYACERFEAEFPASGPLTFFELATALAFEYFAQQRVDMAVIEVGMGGRLDSTNICAPALSVITSISLDHQKQLGQTVSEIAYEKAGIIKPGVPVVIAARDQDARTVIRQKAQQEKAEVRLLDSEFHASWRTLEPEAESRSLGLPGRNACISFRGANQHSELSDPAGAGPLDGEYRVRLLGRHQADNVAAALAALEKMTELGWDFARHKVSAAIGDSQPTARLQVVGEYPLRIVDTAHNVASITAGLEAIREHFGHRPIVAVFASSRDKEYPAMLKVLAEKCERVVLTTYQCNPRAVPVQMLLDSARDNYLNADCTIETAETPLLAWEQALELDLEEHIIYAAGSFFLASELLAGIKL